MHTYVAQQHEHFFLVPPGQLSYFPFPLLCRSPFTGNANPDSSSLFSSLRSPSQTRFLLILLEGPRISLSYLFLSFRSQFALHKAEDGEGKKFLIPAPPTRIPLLIFRERNREGEFVKRNPGLNDRRHTYEKNSISACVYFLRKKLWGKGMWTGYAKNKDWGLLQLHEIRGGERREGRVGCYF